MTWCGMTETVPGDHHRRRGDRHQRGLPPGRAGLHRRAAGGAGPAVLRHHLARGRAGRPAPRVGERHPAGAVLHRAVRPAGGGDRAVGRVPALRRADRGAHRGAADPAAPDRGRGRRVRAAGRAAQPGAGGRALPADGHRRPGRCALAAGRRQGQPDRPDLRAGPGGAGPRRDDPAADPGHRHPDRPRRGDRGAHRRPGTGRHRGRDRRQLRRAVGQAGRRLVRGDRAAALLRALLRGHRADRRGGPGPAGAPRPGRLHLLQGGGGRPGRRRLRAGRQAVGLPRGHPAAVRVPAARRGLGALRAADGAGPAAHPGTARGRASRSSTTARRASPRTTSSSWARRPGCGTSGSPRGSTRSASRPRAARAGRWPGGSWPATRAWT